MRPLQSRPVIMDFNFAYTPIRLRRRGHRRPHRRRWRLPDDAPAGPALQRPPGHRRRYRPALRRRDQGWRHRRPWQQGPYRLEYHRPPGPRQHSAAALTIWCCPACPRPTTPWPRSFPVASASPCCSPAVAILFGRKLRDYAARHEESALRRCCLGKITVLVGAILGVLGHPVLRRGRRPGRGRPLLPLSQTFPDQDCRIGMWPTPFR